MEKNTIIAIVLSTIVLITFMTLQTMFFPAPTPVAPIQNPEQTEEIVSTDLLNTIPAVSQISENFSEIPDEKEEYFNIETNKFKITFTNRGGDVISYELKEHNDKDKLLQMADNITQQNRAFGLSLGGANSKIINDIFSVKQIDDKTIGFFKKFYVKNSDGTESVFTLVKQYKFVDDEYMFRLDIRIDGEENFKGLDFANNAYTLRTSPQIGPYYNKSTDRYENRTFMTYSNDKKKKILLSDNQTKVFDKSYNWTGIGGKYFEILVMPSQSETMSNLLFSTKIEKGDYADAQVFLSRKPIISENTVDTYYIYVGPRTESALASYDKADKNVWGLSNTHLDDSMQSSGLFAWLEVALKWIMEIIYKIIPNWGVAIIIMTILLKLAMYPLTKKSSISTLKMQELQPKMAEIQEKYKDKPEKLNVELAKFYQEAGYNPLTGCLPILLQLPLVIAMFNLFNNYFEFRGAMFIPGWIPDLSVGDSVYTLGFNIPLLGNQIRLLPVVYLVSQLLYSKITQAGNGSAAQMKMMMLIMPIMFFFMFYNAPAGLILYWTISNLLQLVQQVYINKVMHEKKAELAAKKK